MSSKSQIKASNKYDKEKTKSVLLKLNIKTDADILQQLETISESKMGYIKRLIREDMDR